MRKTPPSGRQRITPPVPKQQDNSRVEAAKKPVGIKEIAKALGISIGTVDRALHSRGGINPITKDRVLKMAQTLGYKPNLAARYLKAPRQIRISVILPAHIAAFFDAVRNGIRIAASPFDSAVDLCFRTHLALGEGDVALFQEALEDGSKGIVIAPGHAAQLKPWIRKAAQKGIPVVCVTTDAPGTERLAAVSTNHFTSGAIVGELLSRMVQGGGTAAVMTGDLSIFDHSEKVRGFQWSLAQFSQRLKVAGVLESHDDEATAYNQTRKLVARDQHLKAIYVSTANSLSVLRALDLVDRECRVAVITTDLFPELLPYLRSGRVLATIEQRPEAQGRIGFESLYGFLVEGKCPPPYVKLNPHVVMRSNLDLFLHRIPSGAQWNGQEQIASMCKINFPSSEWRRNTSTCTGASRKKEPSGIVRQREKHRAADHTIVGRNLKLPDP